MNSTDRTYIDDFHKFLLHTDEKNVLADEISKDLDQNSCNSLLDIGAGNGLLATPLSKKVASYTAIESKEKYVTTLRESGLDVIHGKFPLQVSKTYDAVLLSHVLSYREPNYESFIQNAWKCLNSKGVLIVITHRGQEDDWAKFIRYIGLFNPDEYPSIFQGIHDELSRLGNTTVRKVITNVRTTTLEDMISALSFVASNGIPEYKEKFMARIEQIRQFLTHYKVGNEYVFPFQHFILVAKKD